MLSPFVIKGLDWSRESDQFFIAGRKICNLGELIFMRLDYILRSLI